MLPVGFDAIGHKNEDSETQPEAGQDGDENGLFMPMAIALLVAVITVNFFLEVLVPKESNVIF